MSTTAPVVRKYSPFRSLQFYLALLLVAATIILAIGLGLGWWSFNQMLGRFPLHHWLSITGAGFIAVYTPIYAYLKRRQPSRFGLLLNVHVFGNLCAFLLVTIHFSGHIIGPPAVVSLLGTGLAIYTILAIMIVTGLGQKFRLVVKQIRAWRFVHVSFSLSFYIVLIIHVLHNLGIL